VTKPSKCCNQQTHLCLALHETTIISLKEGKPMSGTQVVVGHTSLPNGHEAGCYLGRDVVAKLQGASPNVIIVFASPEYPYETLLNAIRETCSPALLIGCSSAGEFSGCNPGASSVSVMGIRSDDMLFHAAIGRDVSSSREDAVQQILPAFAARHHPAYPFRSAVVLTDVLAGYADDLIHEITVNTGGTYQLFGGGAADDGKFHQTHVFYGHEAVSNAVVVLGILSKKPVGIGVQHGWKASGHPMRVTEADGLRLISLNAIPTVEAFEHHAIANGQVFNRADPLPFFLQNVIGIDTGDGYKIRVPLALNDDGSVSCAAEIPVGATVHIMSASVASASDAARQAAQSAREGLLGGKLAGSLVFDCAATRMRLGAAFSDELQAVSDALGTENYAGCNTYGQIARADGQFSGFHNCTAIVCAFPE
jgi:hypothetical protein